MKNKNVGMLVIGISIIMGFIILIFNLALGDIVNETCSHGPSCGMYKTIAVQTWISVLLAALVFILGLFLFFSKPEEKIIIRKIKPYGELVPKRFNRKSLENLNEEEKRIMNLLLENKGSMFQSDMANNTNFNKVKVTRILDSLEGKGLIERKRRGMTNIIILTS